MRCDCLGWPRAEIILLTTVATSYNLQPVTNCNQLHILRQLIEKGVSLGLFASHIFALPFLQVHWIWVIFLVA